MEGIVNKTSVYTLFYVDRVDSGEFFQSRLQCKSSRAIFLLILCSHKCGILHWEENFRYCKNPFDK